MINRLFINALFCILLSPVICNGIGVFIPDQDAEATARGDAFMAKSDNASAVFYNPAGLTQLNGLNISGTMYGTRITSEYQGLADTQRTSYFLIPHFYAGYHPTDGALAFGVGVYAPYGMGVDYGNSSILRPVIIQDSLNFMAVSGIATWKATPELSIGLGPVFNFASIHIQQGLAPVNMGDLADFKGDGSSVGGTIGMLWNIQRFSIGAVCRGSFPINYDGTFLIIPGATPALSINERAHMKLNIPTQIGFAVGFNITTNLQVETDALWTQWSNWRQSTLIKDSGNINSYYNWNDSWIISIGATYAFLKDYRIHAGYGFAQQTTPDSTFSPAIPDSIRHVVSIGISKDIYSWLTSTITLQQIFGESRNINNGITSPGVYSLSSTAITTSFNLKF